MLTRCFAAPFRKMLPPACAVPDAPLFDERCRMSSRAATAPLMPRRRADARLRQRSVLRHGAHAAAM